MAAALAGFAAFHAVLTKTRGSQPSISPLVTQSAADPELAPNHERRAKALTVNWDMRWPLGCSASVQSLFKKKLCF